MGLTKTAVIAGGTGGIGEGIVKILLQNGWRVFVPARSPEGEQRLKDYVGSVLAEGLVCARVDLCDGAQVAAFRSQVTATGPLGLVVVGVGSSYYGYSLHNLSRTDWDRFIDENLSTHFHVQHEFLGLLHGQDSGVYITLTGPEADFAHPEMGLTPIVASAQKMMVLVEALEAQGTGVRVYSITSKTPIATRSRGAQIGSDWIHPEDLGAYVEGLAEGRIPGGTTATHVLETRDQVLHLLKR